MSTRHIIITTIVIISCIIVTAWVSLQFFCNDIPESSVIVEQEWLDSLQQIAEKEPDIEVDTVIFRDTIKVTEKIEQPIIPPIEKNDTVIYRDTLESDYFNVFLHDRFANNMLISRHWNYEVFIEKETITETIYQPVPLPYPVEKDLPLLYGGFSAGLNTISADINVRINNNNFFGIGTGFIAGEHVIYMRYMRGIDFW